MKHYPEAFGRLKDAMSFKQSAIFEPNFTIWKVFGIWAGKTPNKYYKYYSFSYLFITFFIYNTLLALNLAYTPRNVEQFIPELLFLFTEISITAKILTILVTREKIINTVHLLDCEEFLGDDEITKNIIARNAAMYTKCWKFYNVLVNISYSSQVFGPLFVYLIRGTKLELPICKYYFLSEELREGYFVYWFIYQSIGIYGHVMYNINVDSFSVGLLLMGIAQIKVLGIKLASFKLEAVNSEDKKEYQEMIQISRLNKHLKHFDLILRYCSSIQDILSVTMFVQFGITSAVVCVLMCRLILPLTTESLICMLIYLFGMTLQIFMPAWLGTTLTYESQELVFAAYNCEWIPRSGPFKKSILLFMQRTSTPIQLTGLSLFPLSLDTFTSIMKMAYSFFTLIRSVQDNEDSKN